MLLNETRQQHKLVVNNDNKECCLTDKNFNQQFHCPTVFQHDKNSFGEQCYDDSNQTEIAYEGLNGDYWRTISKRRSSKTISSEFREFFRSNRSIIYDSDDSENESNRSMNVLYRKNTLVACRNISDSFYICQLLEDVRPDSSIVRIRWYSVTSELGDATLIEAHTQLEPSYEDTLDPRAILMELSPIRSARSKMISFKHDDLMETRRLLRRSIRKATLVHRKRKTSVKKVTGISSKLKTFSKVRHIRFPSSEGDSDVDVSTSSVLTTTQTRTIVDSSPSVIKPVHIYFSSGSDDDTDSVTVFAQVQGTKTRFNSSPAFNHGTTLVKRKT